MSVITSRRQPPSGYYLDVLSFKFTFIHVFVLHKSRISRLVLESAHSRFQLNGFYFKFFSLVELRKIFNTVKVKREKSKETG